MNRRVRGSVENDDLGKTEGLSDTCRSATSYTTNVTWTAQGPNSGLRGEMLATDRLWVGSLEPHP